MKINQKEVHTAHLYNWDALRGMPHAIRAAERLGYDVEILVSRDGMGRVHSFQVFASLPEKKEP